MERVRRERTLLQEMEEALEISDDLNEALERQPQLYWQASKEAALATSRRDAAKHELEVVEARTDLNERKASRQKDDGATNPEIKNRVTMNLDVDKATKHLHELSLQHSLWQAMEKSFDQRMNALKKLVDLYLKNYYQESGLSGSQHSMKTHNAHAARRDMAEQRRRRES